jgi:PAS domain S-box-containing protein
VGQPGAILFTPEDREAGEPEKEIETARREGRAPDVRWHLHKGGRRIFIEGSVTALRQSDGRLRGFLKIGQDITERRKAEEKLRESEARQRALIEGVPLLVWRATPEGAWTWSSPQWTEFTGLSEEASRGHGWLDALHADDREPARAAWQSAGKSRALSMETRVFHRGENRYRWFATRAAAVIDDTTGRVIEWLGTSTDIDDLRRLQETQAVMVAELQHRTRNLLAVVRAVAQQTLANSDSLDSFRTQFNDRMAALGRVQGLLSRSDQEPITIGALIRLELDAVGALASDRISASGPEVRIRKAAVQTLALAIHELATNARKYGALASDEGRLAIAWRTTRRDHERRLVIDWVEESIAIDLAAVEKSSGYGRELIGRALPYTLGAVTRYELGATGLRCSIDLPLSEAAQRKEQP